MNAEVTPEVDLSSESYKTNPVPTLTWLRENDPVHWNRNGYWLLTRYNDVAAAFRDQRLSSEWAKKPELLGRPSRDEQTLDRDGRNRATILTSFNMRDAPDHTRLRTLIQLAFTRSAVNEQRQRIQNLVDSYLAQGFANGSIDLVTDLAFPLTITIASEMIGMPVELREQFRTSFELAEKVGDPTATETQRALGRDAIDWQLNTIRHQIELRRSQPSNDLLSALIHAEQDNNRLSEDEIISAVITMYTAGGTTTERFISSGLLLLLQHPDQWKSLATDPALLSGALNEILRFHHPDQQTSTPRLALEDIELHDKKIRAGEMVRLGTGAANRDPERWDNPNVFSIYRPEQQVLSFGLGMHYCIGAPLARLQGEIAIASVVTRYPNTTLLTTEPRRDPRRWDRFEEIKVKLA
jgi:cytochrome P450